MPEACPARNIRIEKWLSRLVVSCRHWSLVKMVSTEHCGRNRTAKAKSLKKYAV